MMTTGNNDVSVPIITGGSGGDDDFAAVTMTTQMPHFLDDTHIDPRWLAAKTGLPLFAECVVVDVSNETRRAAKARDGATLRVTLIPRSSNDDNDIEAKQEQPQPPQTLIIKQTPPQGQALALAKQLGLAREAYFYQHLVRQEFVAEQLLPKIYYAHGDFQEGSKVIVMQDLQHDDSDDNDFFIDSGILFGPGNPNNWKRDLPALLARCSFAGNNAQQQPPTSAHVAKVTFQKIAHIHAAYWKRADLLLNNNDNNIDGGGDDDGKTKTKTDDKGWLRGHDWLQGQGQESWQASQDLIKTGWQKVLDKEEKSSTTTTTINWDPLLRQTVDKAVRGISWQAQLRRLNVHDDNCHWTLVHGDFWPGNVMWKVTNQDDKNDKSSSSSSNNNNNESSSSPSSSCPIRIIDWEMVGLGSGPQDLGQYIISNMVPAERRQCERDLIETYYKELLLVWKSQKNDDNNNASLSLSSTSTTFTLEECWSEYCIGGLERWIWFLVYFLSAEMYDWAQFCHNQMAEFQKDHNLTLDQITQPRP